MLKGVITTPSVREHFNTEEIAEAHADFMLDGPSLVDEASGKGLGIFEAEPGRVMVFVSEADGDMLYISTPHDFGSSAGDPHLSTSRVLARIAGYAALLGMCLLFWAALLTVTFVNWQTTAIQLGLGAALGVAGVFAFAGEAGGKLDY
jgi:hypothetical protein